MYTRGLNKNKRCFILFTNNSKNIKSRQDQVQTHWKIKLLPVSLILTEVTLITKLVYKFNFELFPQQFVTNLYYCLKCLINVSHSHTNNVIAVNSSVCNYPQNMDLDLSKCFVFCFLLLFYCICVCERKDSNLLTVLSLVFVVSFKFFL